MLQANGWTVVSIIVFAIIGLIAYYIRLRHERTVVSGLTFNSHQMVIKIKQGEVKRDHFVFYADNFLGQVDVYSEEFDANKAYQIVQEMVRCGSPAEVFSKLPIKSMAI